MGNERELSTNLSDLIAKEIAKSNVECKYSFSELMEMLENDTDMDYIFVSLFDEKEDRYRDAKLKFVGEWIKVCLYDEDGLLEEESCIQNSVEPKYQVWEVQGITCTVFSSVGKFKVLWNHYIDIVEYMNKVYEEQVQERKNTYAKIVTQCEQFLQDNENFRFICNFLDKIQLEMLLSPMVLTEFDRVLEVNYNYREEFLLSDEAFRVFVAKVYEEKSIRELPGMIPIESIRYNIVSANINEIYRYINEEFGYLKNHLKTKLDLEDENLIIFVHTLTHIGAQIKAANEFEENDMCLWDMADFSNLEKAVCKYIDCGIINEEDTYNEFKFVSFLMRKTKIFEELNYIKCFLIFDDKKTKMLAQKKQRDFIHRLKEE